MKTIIFLSMFLLNLSACSQNNDGVIPPDIEVSDTTNSTKPSTGNTMQIIINHSVFKATLADNATAKAFKATLPMTVSMSDLNNNEKFYHLSGNLPTAASNFGTIRNGDIMLFGSNCLVLFYKTFSTSYRYTKIGSIDNPSGFEAALGRGSVSVTFELTND